MMVEGKRLEGQGQKSDALPKKGGPISCWDFAGKNILLCMLGLLDVMRCVLEPLDVELKEESHKKIRE